MGELFCNMRRVGPVLRIIMCTSPNMDRSPENKTLHTMPAAYTALDRCTLEFLFYDCRGGTRVDNPGGSPNRWCSSGAET